jgi:polar amino acid transport system substrate-binding protein
MKIRVIALFLMLLPLFAFGKDIEVTIYVDDAYIPFSYMADGQAKGMYIDVLKAVFKKMDGFKVSMTPVPWKRGRYMMERGNGFGLAPAFFHGHDWPYIYPYSLPFYTETIIAVCNENILKQPKPNWPEDYKGLSIGNVAGFDGWGGDKFRSLVKDGKIGYFELKGSEKIIRRLLIKRCDCIMMENRAFDYEIDRMKKAGIYDAKSGTYKAFKGIYEKKILSKFKKGAIIGTDPVYIGYSETAIKNGKYQYAYKFRKSFDRIVYKMTKSGEIERIMDAYKE